MSQPWSRVLPAVAVALAACATTGGTPEELRPVPLPVSGAALPAIAEVDGALAIDIVYPPDSAVLGARDSTFVFGSTGSGRATLLVNGEGVDVAPNGAFLAFLPVPADGIYRIHATRAAETATLERRVVVPPPPSVPDSGATILPESIAPRGAIALPTGEAVDVSFLGTAGGSATLRLPDGRTVPFLEQTPADPGVAAANFQRLPGRPATAGRGVSLYVAAVPAGQWMAVDTGVPVPALSPGLSAASGEPLGDTALFRNAGTPIITLSAGADTARAPLPANLNALGVQESAVGRTAVVRAPANAPSDWTIRGRPGRSGPFHWFWPDGTLLRLDGEWNGLYRVRLARDLAAWVPAGDVALLDAGAPLPRGDVTGVRLIPAAEWVDVRIPAGIRMPYRIDGDGGLLRITVYGATSAVNFLQYGALDSLVRRVAWSQPADGVFTVDVELAQAVWGYHAFFDEADALIVRIRRPPVIDPARPLRGLLVAVDAGHPPAGATGPTRLSEAEANLGVALRLKPLLEAAGARVLLTRTDAAPVELGARPRLAAAFDAHLLVSLHNNAFPDGVNPFANNGTSAYYYQPHSADLARAVQQALLEELGLRDLGIGRADLALVRPTWMPSVLTETMFMMLPEQENALRDPEVQESIARAHVRGLERFLAARAGRTGNR